MGAVPVDQLTEAEKEELLCTYAALVLHDDGAEINPQNMTNLIKASGNEVASYWPSLFCKMISNHSMESLISMGSCAGGGTSVAMQPSDVGAASAAGGAKKDEQKAEVEEEEEEMDFDLFG